MFKGIKVFLMLGLITAMCACASKQEDELVSYDTLKYKYPYLANVKVREDPANAEVGKQIVKHANTVMGTPYVLGGSKPGGFDCSGLVMWAYNRVGVKLPRTAMEQSSVGKKIENKEDMRPGDIVAFRHPKRGYHTGIYIGEGKFIHSPRKRSFVKVASLDDNYFKKTLLGARRVNLDCNNIVLAGAGDQLNNYMEKRGYQEVVSPAPVTKKSVKKSSRSKSKNIGSKKSSKPSQVAAARNSSKKIALRKPVVKSRAKSLAQNNKTVKTSRTTKVSAKSGQKAISLLNKKTKR